MKIGEYMNNEIITINEKDGIKTVSARELHEKLEIESKFMDWFNRMLKYGFEEGKDYVLVSRKKETNNPKNPVTIFNEYFISIDMAKEICMIQRSEIGRKVRQYFIECEKKLSSIENQKVVQIEDSPLEKAKFLHEIAGEYSENKTYKQILDAYAVKEVAGKFILPLPELEETNYSATEVGKMLGISAKKVGSIAIKMGIKVDGEFGKWYVDKSRNSNKEVNTFRYTKKAVELIKENV